jgi:small subunit ribosomal protein S16
MGTLEIENVCVRIRLKRMGRRHRAAYRLTAIDKRRPRDSRVIEELGSFDPLFPKEEEQLQLKRERIEYWLGVGAQPTDTVRRILEKQGILPASVGKFTAKRG